MTNKVEIVVTAEDKASSVLTGVSDKLSGMAKFAGGVAFAGLAGVAAAMGTAGVAAIKMNSELETSTLQFETLMGDADRAEKHVKSLFDFAAKTPFETGPIIEASRLLQVFGGDALNTDENLTLIGNTAAAVGAPLESIGFWVGRAYAAIQGGQPFGDAAASLMEMGAVSPTVIEEMKALEKAGGSADEIFGLLQSHLDGFAGSMEKQAGTWEGLKSTIVDNLNMAAATALRPFFELAQDGMARFAEWLSSPAIQDGIQQIATNFGLLIQTVGDFVTNQVIPFVEEHGEQLKTILLDVGKAFAALAVIGTVVSWVSSLIGVIGGAAAAFSAAGGGIAGIVAILGGPVTLAIGAVVAAVGLLTVAWRNNWGDIQGKTASAIAFIREVINSALSAINSWWNEHGASITAAAEKAWNLIQGLIDGVINHIKLVVDTFRAAFEGDWERFGANIFHIWANAWDTVVNFLSGLWDLVVPFLISLWNNFVSWFKNTDWKSLGQSIIDGLIDGINNGINAVQAAVRGLINAALSRFGIELDSNSPSKETEYFGRMASLGFAKGITSGIKEVDKAVGNLFGAANFASGGMNLSTNATMGGYNIASGYSSGGTTIINIDARGAARGVDTDIRKAVEKVLKEYGSQTDLRMRVSYG